MARRSVFGELVRAKTAAYLAAARWAREVVEGRVDRALRVAALTMFKVCHASAPAVKGSRRKKFSHLFFAARLDCWPWTGQGMRVNTTRLCITLTAEELEALQARAVSWGCNLSEAVGRLATGTKRKRLHGGRRHRTKRWNLSDELEQLL